MKQKLIFWSIVLMGMFVLVWYANYSGENQSVTVKVTAGGYYPEVREVKKGIPVVLNFQTDANPGCAGYMEIPDFGVRLLLEPNKTIPVKIVPKEAGDLVIKCAMNMFSTTLTVK